MIAVPRRHIVGFCLSLSLLVSSFLINSPAQAGTIVRVSTSMGDYSIELLDDIAPLTVQNFLNYVNRNAYNNTYLHRVLSGFVAQGGGFRFQPFVGAVAVPEDPPVPNEFNVSNTRGTVAMAKFGDDPDSATSQWFVNLADNSSLDVNNGGFTVFGNVLGDGMLILDAIENLPTINLGVNTSNAPFVTESYRLPYDFVYINVEVVDRYSGAAHVFESSSGLLITSVDIDAGSDLISMNFNTVATVPDFVIQSNPESVIPRRDSFDGIATYSTSDNRLRIPTLEVNSGGNIVVVSNVVFVLTDAAQGLLTLESFDQ
jgi:peptidyl-prolyl cis-trans isomerase A (cyclophilin A)